MQPVLYGNTTQGRPQPSSFKAGGTSLTSVGASNAHSTLSSAYVTSTSSPVWTKGSSSYTVTTVKPSQGQGNQTHTRLQTHGAEGVKTFISSEDVDAGTRIESGFPPTLKRTHCSRWSGTGTPDLKEKVVSEVIRTPRRVQRAGGTTSIASSHPRSEGASQLYKHLKQAEYKAENKGTISSSTPLQAVASPCRAYRPIPPPASPQEEASGSTSEEPSPLQAEGLKKTLVAEEMDTQQVKIYMLETRTGETAVAVERPDGKRWRFMRNSIDFELQCTADALQQWLDGLTSEQLPGLLTLLANEVNTRGEALKTAEKERDSLRGSEDYEFFGLDGQQCTDKDIERAYRKKSTQLHPDKGGDEESFNHMREKYEQLKSLRDTTKRSKGGGSIKWDARSRESMLRAHVDLREQLVWITRHLTDVEEELKVLKSRQVAKSCLGWQPPSDQVVL
mgnify:FL=1